MTPCSSDDCKEAVSSQPPMDETTFDAGTLTLYLVEDILCRLPVKLLMQFQCVCKSWNSLISDPIFVKKHLHCSQTLFNRHHLVSCSNDRRFQKLWDSSLPSFFNSASTSIPSTQLYFPLNILEGSYKIIGSCDGILCFSIGKYNNCVMVWNPSIRKFKILPPLEDQPKVFDGETIYGFGYDRLTDNYKVVAFCCYAVDGFNWVCKKVIHTLGTNTWKTIQDVPSGSGGLPLCNCGMFLSGTINWLGDTRPPFMSLFVFSFDLGTESYQKFLHPHGGVDVCGMKLGVLRDCLCTLSYTRTLDIHVWLMEDYGNKDSWTKLFVVTCHKLFTDLNCIYPLYPLYILDDGQLLLDFKEKLAVYNSRNRTVNILKVQSISDDCSFDNHIYIESLISP